MRPAPTTASSASPREVLHSHGHAVMRTLKICLTCSKKFSALAPSEHCSDCASGVDLPSSQGSQDPPIAPLASDDTVFGHYALGSRIGSGGMGVVYKARDLKLDREVAIKMLHGGEHASTIALTLFQAEVRAYARLDHPNVVPIYQAGEYAGQLYFTMKLFPADLKSQLERLAGDPVGSAVLVEKIALAVRHLHQHGILHRDLKPANILLDDATPPNPYVADFGVARLIGEDGQLLRTGVIVGTPQYMAPEQAAGRDVTWAADVYGLGVILYELLVRELPFHGSAQELERAKQSPPKDPHDLDPRIDRDLARICLRCLDKEPEHRYPSAQALALALRRFLDGEPFEGAGRARRLWRWCLRHSVLTGLLLGTLLFLTLVTSRAVALVGEQETEKRAQIRLVNMNRAANVAGTVLSHIRSLSDAVARAAADPALAVAINGDDPGQMQRFCEATYTYYEDPANGLTFDKRSAFSLWFVLDNKGTLRAQYGTAAHLEREFAWRDYFIGAQGLSEYPRRSTYVSRAFRSEGDLHHKFAISAPIVDDAGQSVGVIVAGIAAKANLGSLALDDGQSVAVLVAPRDRERDSDPRTEFPYLILRHPAFADGEAVEMASEQVRLVAGADPELDQWLPAPNRMATIDGYIDPVAMVHPDYAGSWSAGFAPVGNTGFVVIVQSREDETMKAEMALVRQLAKWTAISTIPGVLLVSFAALYSRRRRRPKGV